MTLRCPEQSSIKRVRSRQAPPLENSPAWQKVRVWLALTVPVQPARLCSGGQTAHGPFTQIQRRKLGTTFVVASDLGDGDGFRKGCRRNEKKLFFSDGSVLPRAPALVSRMPCTAFKRGSRTTGWDDTEDGLELRALETCETALPELCELELDELDPPELRLLAEPPEEPDPAEELLWEPPPPLELLEALELLLAPDECWANAADENNRTAATHRLESRIKHLVPTGPELEMPWSVSTLPSNKTILPNRVKQRSNWVKKCYAGFSGQPNRIACPWSSSYSA
jgi:hypothetical protein